MKFREFEFKTVEEGLLELQDAVDKSVSMRGNPAKSEVDNDIRIMVIHLENMGVSQSKLDEMTAPTKGTWRSVMDVPITDGEYTVKFMRSNWTAVGVIETAKRKFVNGKWENPNFKCPHDGWHLTQWYDEPGPYSKIETETITPVSTIA